MYPRLVCENEEWMSWMKRVESVEKSTGNFSTPLITCDRCERETAVLYCPQDRAHFCTTCDQTHHQGSKLLLKHQRLPIYHTPFQFGWCDTHRTHKLEWFCEDCGLLLCEICVTAGAHSDRNFHHHSLISSIDAFTKSTNIKHTSDTGQLSKSFYQTKRGIFSLLHEADELIQVMTTNAADVSDSLNKQLNDIVHSIDDIAKAKLSLWAGLKRQMLLRLLIVEWVDAWTVHMRLSLGGESWLKKNACMEFVENDDVTETELVSDVKKSGKWWLLFGNQSHGVPNGMSSSMSIGESDKPGSFYSSKLPPWLWQTVGIAGSLTIDESATIIPNVQEDNSMLNWVLPDHAQLIGNPENVVYASNSVSKPGNTNSQITPTGATHHLSNFNQLENLAEKQRSGIFVNFQDTVSLVEKTKAAIDDFSLHALPPPTQSRPDSGNPNLLNPTSSSIDPTTSSMRSSKFSAVGDRLKERLMGGTVPFENSLHLLKGTSVSDRPEVLRGIFGLIAAIRGSSHVIDLDNNEATLFLRRVVADSVFTCRSVALIPSASSLVASLANIFVSVSVDSRLDNVIKKSITQVFSTNSNNYDSILYSGTNRTVYGDQLGSTYLGGLGNSVNPSSGNFTDSDALRVAKKIIDNVSNMEISSVISEDVQFFLRIVAEETTARFSIQGWGVTAAVFSSRILTPVLIRVAANELAANTNQSTSAQSIPREISLISKQLQRIGHFEESNEDETVRECFYALRDWIRNGVDLKSNFTRSTELQRDDILSTVIHSSGGYLLSSQFLSAVTSDFQGRSPEQIVNEYITKYGGIV